MVDPFFSHLRAHDADSCRCPPSAYHNFGPYCEPLLEWELYVFSPSNILALTDEFAWDRGSGRPVKLSRTDIDVGLSDLLDSFRVGIGHSAEIGLLSRVCGTRTRRYIIQISE